jgi:predicted short-subunit dehydrogenase-like oxidoreductase (DUF2520 family)
MPTLNIIGFGKVGATFAGLFAKDLQAIYNRTVNSSTVNGKSIINDLNILPQAKVNIISTSDDAILKIVNLLCAQHDSLDKQIFLHCSGLLSSDELAPLRAKGALIASLHPMRSFADPAIAAQNFSGTFCALEGDEAALDIIEPMFQELGAQTYRINKDQKPAYHIAGVFASNYMVTLASMAKKLLSDANLPNETVNQVVLSVMQGTLTNISSNIDNLALALTGPLQRGDEKTLHKHIEYFKQYDLASLKFYNILALYTLPLTKHSDEHKAILRNIFTLTD